MSTKAIYTVHERGKDFHFFSEYAGGFSYPFAAANFLSRLKYVLDGAMSPQKNLCVSPLLEQMKEAVSKDIETFATSLFLFRRTIVVLSGNCISPLVMNAFFTASISAWTNYCELIGREQIFENLTKTTQCLRDGDADTAEELFRSHIERFREHILM